MPSTQITEITSSVDTIAARTDSTGVGVTDWGAEERRMDYMFYAAGVFGVPETAWKPVAGNAATMNVVLGSGFAKSDLALVSGLTAGQGKYLVRLDEAGKTLALDAADVSQDRTDQIYLVVYDNLYDSSSRSLPRLAVRKGDLGGAVPGADGNWEAHLLLATITVPAGAADITECTVTDSRSFMRSLVGGGGEPGDIKATGRATAPDGHFLCNGQTVSRTTYARLFAAIGTTFGAGNGSTTFTLPDLRQRVPLGKSASGTGSTLGSTGGDINHTHDGSISVAPNHTHSVTGTANSGGGHQHGFSATSGSGGSHQHQILFDGDVGSYGHDPNNPTHNRHRLGGDGVGANGSHNHSVSGTSGTAGAHTHTLSGTAGSSGTHDHQLLSTTTENMPYQVVNFIIKY